MSVESHSTRATAMLALGALLAAAGANGAPRTFVASYGNDADACSLTAPCRQFAAAILNTDPAGEIIVLDSAGYGVVAITQSVTITAPRGVYAGISVFLGSDGVTVNGSGIDVTLRGLTINGRGGAYGVNVVDGARTTIERCAIRNMDSEGVLLQAGEATITETSITRSTASGLRVAAGASAAIADSRIESNGGYGVWLLEMATASIERSVIAGNGASGINVYTGNPTTMLVVRSSVIADHPMGGGVSVQSIVAGTAARLDISGNTIARNDNGIEAGAPPAGATVVNATNNQIADSTFAGIFANNAGTTVRASGNAIFRGQYGLRAEGGAVIYSPGNNYVHDNSTLDDSTHTPDSLL